jgi:hypothetical protein
VERLGLLSSLYLLFYHHAKWFTWRVVQALLRSAARRPTFTYAFHFSNGAPQLAASVGNL